MRKSLGNKRNFISDKQIEEITRLYGDFKESKWVKNFDNEDFGYWRVTVERPLKLNFAANKERIEKLKESKAFKRAKSRDEILEILESISSNKVWKNRENFVEFLKGFFKDKGVKLDAPILKAVLSALGERDETADVCTDSKGNPESDSDLRDYENIPLKEDIEEYFKREVIPYVPDAWIDHSKTKNP